MTCRHGFPLEEMCEVCKAYDKIFMRKVREWEREFKISKKSNADGSEGNECFMS